VLPSEIIVDKEWFWNAMEVMKEQEGKGAYEL
jgi:hypothetical protein